MLDIFCCEPVYFIAKINMYIESLCPSLCFVLNTVLQEMTAGFTELHSKNTRVTVTRGKGPLGPNSIPGQHVTRKSVNLTRNMTQSWVNLTPLFVSLTTFRVIVDPE